MCECCSCLGNFVRAVRFSLNSDLLVIHISPTEHEAVIPSNVVNREKSSTSSCTNDSRLKLPMQLKLVLQKIPYCVGSTFVTSNAYDAPTRETVSTIATDLGALIPSNVVHSEKVQVILFKILKKVQHGIS